MPRLMVEIRLYWSDAKDRERDVLVHRAAATSEIAWSPPLELVPIAEPGVVLRSFRYVPTVFSLPVQAPPAA